MKLMGWIILLGLALLVAFAVANWTLFTAPHTLDLLFMQVSAPLALVLLAVTLAFVAVFTIYALSLRTTALVETRRQFKELEAQRKLADTAEGSRLTALGAQVAEECARIRADLDEAHAESLRRAEALEASVLKALTENVNALFANVGEVDEKLNRLVASLERPAGA